MKENIESNYEKLIKDLESDVACGDVQAMKWLGDVYYQGDDKHASNLSLALKYWKMAADHGNALSQGKVGISYLNGDGLPKDEKLGLKYIEMAANAGEIYPQFLTGICYLNGVGCVKNRYNAGKYLRMAASNNYVDAQVALGKAMYTQDVPDPNNECVHWMCCAFSNKSNEAREILEFWRSKGLDDQTLVDCFRNIKENGVALQTEYTNEAAKTSEGCYIATAVYGSYDAPEVMVLRKFRDEVLKKSIAGRIFIKLYYKFSPSFANKLKSKKRINLLVKKILNIYVELLMKKV